MADLEFIDFESAELFLQQAREAHQQGDATKCMAARKLVAIALNLTDGPRPAIQTAHLKGA
jgi:hypothetical protein